MKNSLTNTSKQTSSTNNSYYIKLKRQAKRDMARIDNALDSSLSLDELKNLHIIIDAFYQSKINDWGKSMYGYNEQLGFNLDMLGIQSIRENLIAMKSKIYSYILHFKIDLNDKTETNSVLSFTINNSNYLNVLSFEDARKRITEINTDDPREKEIILEKLNGLEKIIANSNISKTEKWKKANPILKCIIDKSIDVASVFFSLLLQKLM